MLHNALNLPSSVTIPEEYKSLETRGRISQYSSIHHPLHKAMKVPQSKSQHSSLLQQVWVTNRLLSNLSQSLIY